MPNGLNEPVDPGDPGSVIRWTARAAAAFEQISRELTTIRENQAAITEWRVGIETRLATGAQRFADQDRTITEIRRQAADLPDIVRRAVQQALPKRSNPNKEDAEEPNGTGGKVTFKWLLEKVALPLLMSGIGAGITLAVARAMGALVSAVP